MRYCLSSTTSMAKAGFLSSSTLTHWRTKELSKKGRKRNLRLRARTAHKDLHYDFLNFLTHIKPRLASTHSDIMLWFAPLLFILGLWLSLDFFYFCIERVAFSFSRSPPNGCAPACLPHRMPNLFYACLPACPRGWGLSNLSNYFSFFFFLFKIVCRWRMVPFFFLSFFLSFSPLFLPFPSFCSFCFFVFFFCCPFSLNVKQKVQKLNSNLIYFPLQNSGAVSF